MEPAYLRPSGDSIHIGGLKIAENWPHIFGFNLVAADYSNFIAQNPYNLFNGVRWPQI